MPRPGRPRRQSADEDDTRVGGGHPDYVVRADPDPDDPDAPRPTYQQDLWHYTIARMVDACVTNGILPFYGPFGDIKDTVACEDQFRNAYLLGCVGAWSLHPAQIEIAKRVFSPRPADVAQAQRVIDAMGDGTGAIMLDGKMEDDASVKQCQVVVGAGPAARRPRPRARGGVRVLRTRDDDRRCVLAVRCCTCPRPTSGRWRRPRRSPADAIIFDLEDAVAPDAKAAARPNAVAAASSGEYGRRELTIRCNGLDTPWGADDLAAAAQVRRRRRRHPEGRLGGVPRRGRRRGSTPRAPPTTLTIWAMIETPTADLRRPRDRRPPPRVACW